MTDYENLNKFILDRISKKKYRGKPSSEHNRLICNVNYIWTILNWMYKNSFLSSNKDRFLRIRDTDKSKEIDIDHENLWSEYSELVKLLKQKFKKTTEDSLRKNIFVDLARVGFIKRFNYEKIMLNDYADTNLINHSNKIKLKSKKSIKYVALNDEIFHDFNDKFVEFDQFQNKHENKNFKELCDSRFDILTNGISELIIEILKNGENSELKNKLYLNEIQFFVSWIGANKNENECYTLEEMVKLIKKFRNLREEKKVTFNALIEKIISETNINLKSDCKKDEKKDYSNWKNKNQQIVSIIKVFLQNKLIVKKDDNKEVFVSLNIGPIRRNSKEKNKWYQKNEIDKDAYFGWQLHHIVPFSFKKQIYWDNVDSWDNMLLINATKHQEISKYNFGEKFIQLKIDPITFNVKLIAQFNNEIEPIILKYGEDVIFKKNLRKNYENKNLALLKFLN